MKTIKVTAIILFVAILTISSQGKALLKESAVDNSNLVTAYLEVKDALVKTNSAEASEAASKMVKLLDGMKDELSVKLIEDAKAISASSDVEEQRKSFNSLSQSMYSYVRDNGSEHQGLYKQYCPMAFKNTGAFWLASETEINNPYFGSRMLKCGVVQETLSN